MMKNYLSITFAAAAAILLLGLIGTGVRMQQAQTTVIRKQEEIRELQLKNGALQDRYWIEMQEKMREAGR